MPALPLAATIFRNVFDRFTTFRHIASMLCAVCTSPRFAVGLPTQILLLAGGLLCRVSASDSFCVKLSSLLRVGGAVNRKLPVHSFLVGGLGASRASNVLEVLLLLHERRTAGLMEVETRNVNYLLNTILKYEPD
jgi:hypothetical protein